MKIPEPVRQHILRRVYQMATGRRDSQEWDEAWEHIKRKFPPVISAGTAQSLHG